MAKTPYTIDYAEGVGEDLANLRAYERKNILDAIDKQLLHEPTRQTKNRNWPPDTLPERPGKPFPRRHCEPLKGAKQSPEAVLEIASGAPRPRNDYLE